MAGFESVFGTGSAAPVKTTTPFSNVFEGSTNVAETRQALGQQAGDARAAAGQANSPLGLAVNTAKAFGDTVFNAGKDAVSGLADTYGSLVPQAVSQVESGAGDIAKGGVGNIVKGATKAALGTAGGFAGAVYAPIGAAIGAALQATGAQHLLDSSGQVVADTSGITDIPAFQKFAMEHPNAGNYFGQTMNLVLGGADDGKILESSKKTANAIVDTAAKQPPPPPKTPPVDYTLPQKTLVESGGYPERATLGDRLLDSQDLNRAGRRAFMQDNKNLDFTKRGDYTKIPVRDANTVTLPVSDLSEPSGDVPINNRSVSEPVSQPTTTDRPDGVVINSDGSKTTTSNGGRVSITETPVDNVPIKSSGASGEQAPTKVANDISANLVKEGVAELTPEQKSTYTTGSYKDSAEQGRILQEQDPEALKQMAITGKGIPEGVHPQILFNIVDKLAADTKDYRLQQDLAKSPLGTERSESAQKLGSSGFNKVNDSPVEVIRRAAEKKAGGEKGAKEVAAEARKAKNTITKAAAKMMDYQSIVDAIKTC